MDSNRLLNTQLRTAAEAWEELRSTRVPADRWIGNFFHRNRKRFGSRDRRFLSETLYSLFRNKTYLELWAVSAGHPEDSFLMALMAAVLEDLVHDREFYEQCADYFQGVGMKESLYSSLLEKRLPKAGGFESAAEELSLRYSFPLWLVKRWTEAFGEKKCAELIAAFHERPPLTIRNNPITISKQRLIEKFKRRGLNVRPAELSPFGIIFAERFNIFEREEFQRGFFEVQDEGSQLMCHMVDAKPGDLVWDVCAGSGGKSLLLAAMMDNKGRIIATDKHMKKLEDLKKRAKRAGAFNIFPADLERVDEIKALSKGADKILVDAPCSGTGTYRRNPDAKWKLTEGDFASFAAQQLEILESVLPYLRKDGKIYYVTCSIDRAENEDVIARFVERHPELVPAKIRTDYAESLSIGDGMYRIWPYRDGPDGFFMTMLRKTT